MSYQNPVHPYSCPDPFVLKHAGEYWCYCTGLRPDGGAFGILHSTDLVSWREVGSALAHLPGGHTCYWAPEVTYDNGRFYMYYSVGDETNMVIRVAVAQQPAGPFEDSGHVLTSEDFAIDAHVFTDDDGQRYLFYATDFLTHTHIGTGLAADRLLDPYHLAGEPQPVVRARYDWQVYDPQRAEKGGVRWHTVEGPFVLKRKGRYALLYSGGNWQNVTYGVGYAMSDTLLPDGEWAQVTDGGAVQPILRTRPEADIVGPGHNSVVRGPDNQQLFCVYHRWSRERNDRVLAIDRLEWVGDRLLVLGPTHTAQPAPNAPAVSDFGAWAWGAGAWRVGEDGHARQSQPDGEAGAHLSVPGLQFVLEVTLAGVSRPAALQAAYGVEVLGARPEATLRLALLPGLGAVSATVGGVEDDQAVPDGFDFSAQHLLRVEVDGERVYARLDDGLWRWTGRLAAPVAALTLFTAETSAAFSGPALTLGWQDDFEEATTPEALGWETVGQAGQWRVTDGALRQTQAAAHGSMLAKGTPLEAYELVINGRLQTDGETEAQARGWGVYPAYRDAAETGPLCTVEPHQGRWGLVVRPGLASVEPVDARPGEHVFPLPDSFDPYVFQQLRFRVRAGQLSIQWADQPLGSLAAPARPGRVALYAPQAAAWEMVRVTGL